MSHISDKDDYPPESASVLSGLKPSRERPDGSFVITDPEHLAVLEKAKAQIDRGEWIDIDDVIAEMDEILKD